MYREVSRGSKMRYRIARKMSSWKKVEETVVSNEQFVELTASGTWEVEGNRESGEHYEKVFSSRGERDKGMLWLATDGDVEVVCDTRWNFRIKFETKFGINVGIYDKLASKRQESNLAGGRLDRILPDFICVRCFLLEGRHTQKANGKVSGDHFERSGVCWVLSHKFCMSSHYWLAWFCRTTPKIMFFSKLSPWRS